MRLHQAIMQFVLKHNSSKPGGLLDAKDTG